MWPLTSAVAQRADRRLVPGMGLERLVRQAALGHPAPGLDSADQPVGEPDPIERGLDLQ